MYVHTYVLLAHCDLVRVMNVGTVVSGALALRGQQGERTDLPTRHY